MSTTLKEQFANDGYVVMPKLFSKEEVCQLKEEAAKVIADNEVGKEGVYVGLSAASPIFRKAAAHPELVAALKQIVGSHIVFLSDKLVFKNKTTHFGSPWHQDYPYWEGSHKYSVWIALDDATPENGCLKVVPGSHLLGNIHHDGDASDGLGFGNRLNEQHIDPSQVVPLSASQGDAIIFHDLLYHSSYPNTSGKDRWALISTYKDGTKDDPIYAWAKAAFTL